LKGNIDKDLKHGSENGVDKSSDFNDSDSKNNHIPDGIIDANLSINSLSDLNLNEADSSSNENDKECIENNIHTSSLGCWKVMVIASASYQAEVCTLCMYLCIYRMYV
jgi:hypothetical protein